MQIETEPQITKKHIRELEKKIAGKVLKDKNIHLEREVIYISPDGKKY